MERTFDLEDVTEDEMRVMKALLAQGEDEAREKLVERSQWWEDRMSEEEALELAKGVISDVDGAVRGG